MAAKRSRDARRMKENQIALRAGFLEKEVRIRLRFRIEYHRITFKFTFYFYKKNRIRKFTLILSS